jgi:7,8-dihydropterin-6-yl-methyl-4-(beta-D-ribofuranosyl)aminobenzene 5'-phosphate synthase
MTAPGLLLRGISAEMGIMINLSRFKLVYLIGIAIGLVSLSIACQSAETRIAASISPTTTAHAAAAPMIAPSEPTATRRLSPVPMLTLTPMANVKPITLTIVYDNRSADPRLGTAWGFACLIETRAVTILFDTGGDGQLLMDNLAALGIDPQAIDAVVLSHAHHDHTGGLDRLLAVNDHLTVYLPRSFPASFKGRIHNPIIEVSEPMTIMEQSPSSGGADRIRTTGELGTAIVEQALIIEARHGLIVLTGCAHPGIVEMVREATPYGAVYLVMGGFHLADHSVAEVQGVIAELKRLGVQQVAPSHCTGDRAIEQFHQEFGTGFIPVGAGAILHAEQ